MNSGWRDSDGRTARERKQQRGETERQHFKATLRHRPMSLLKGLLGFGFIVLLVIALVVGLR